MSRLVAYLRSLMSWLARPKLAWLGLAVTTLLTCFALRSAATEPQIRASGLLLQWLGIGTVALGVRKTRQLFGEPSFLDQLRSWLSDRPKWRRDIVMMTGTGAMHMALGNAHLDIWSDVPEDASTEAKITALMNNVKRLREGLQSIRKSIEATNRAHSTALANEQQLRAAADSQLDARLREAHTGGLHITFMGALWLFLGVLFSTIPGEIYSWRH